MAFPAGSTLSAAALNVALGLTTQTAFTTTTPAGSGWYRLTAGGMVEVHFESTGNVSATTAVTLDSTLPVGYRPSGRIAVTATSGTSPRLAAANILADGSMIVYNGQGSATTVYFHGLFMAA